MNPHVGLQSIQAFVFNHQLEVLVSSPCFITSSQVTLGRLLNFSVSLSFLYKTKGFILKRSWLSKHSFKVHFRNIFKCKLYMVATLFLLCFLLSESFSFQQVGSGYHGILRLSFSLCLSLPLPVSPAQLSDRSALFPLKCLSVQEW